MKPPEGSHNRKETVSFPSADIVLPVCHHLNSVIDCVESIFENTRPGTYTLFVIDDHADRWVQRYLEKVSRDRAGIRIDRNSGEPGYLNALRFGMELGSSPYVVFLDCGDVVPPAWLERLISCVESDTAIVRVTPLSNAAATARLPMIPGANFLGMDAYVKRHFKGVFFNTAVDNGSCMLIKRAAVNESWPPHLPGFKITKRGDGVRMPAARPCRSVAACDVYVYHKENVRNASDSKTHGNSRPGSGCQRLSECRRLYREIRENDVPDRIQFRFSGQKRWDPMPVVWQTARNLLSSVREKRLGAVPVIAVSGLIRLFQAKRLLPSKEYSRELTRPRRLRVTYILHDMVIAGGVLSVIQIVNELILLGVEARIVTFFKDPAVSAWTRLYTEPVVYKNEHEMLDCFPPTDIAVATLWITAPMVNRLVRQGKAGVGAYFIQDYEPWFFPETDTASRKRVRDTFAVIPNRIVKSRWLAGMLEREGFDSCQIPLGMDLGQFYPRDAGKDRPVVLAMVRPKTPRRGFGPTIAALAMVKKRMPDAEIVLFGDRFLGNYSIPFEFRDEGVVMDQNRLAELYSQAHVFLDGSDFQGFGRCGLEAMACGAACVLTGAGGVTEYAVNGENALIVPPKQPDRFAAAILDLLHNPRLRDHLAEGGRRTVQRFCHKREARATRDYLMALAAKSGLHPEVGSI